MDQVGVENVVEVIKAKKVDLVLKEDTDLKVVKTHYIEESQKKILQVQHQ